MPLLLSVLVALLAIGLGISWFMRAKRSAVARRARIGGAFIGAIALGVLLLFGVRFLPSILPELFGLAGILLTAAVARFVRQRPAGGFSTPGRAQRTQVRTAFVEAWIDHEAGDVGGQVIAGTFAGRTFAALSPSELMTLLQECAADGESSRVLEAYLDRRLGEGWRSREQTPPPAGPRGEMSRAEALAVLGLARDASPEDVKSAYRRLIQKVHPDVGGSADLAARINQARDVLLGV